MAGETNTRAYMLLSERPKPTVWATHGYACWKLRQWLLQRSPSLCTGGGVLPLNPQGGVVPKQPEPLVNPDQPRGVQPLKSSSGEASAQPSVCCWACVPLLDWLPWCCCMGPRQLAA